MREEGRLVTGWLNLLIISFYSFPLPPPPPLPFLSTFSRGLQVRGGKKREGSKYYLSEKVMWVMQGGYCFMGLLKYPVSCKKVRWVRETGRDKMGPVKYGARVRWVMEEGREWNEELMILEPYVRWVRDDGRQSTAFANLY